MSVTIGALVDSALAEVMGYTQLVDTETYLTAPATATDLSLTVASAANFSRGIVQIGDELLVVDTVDRDNGVLGLGSVAGRGVRGSTAATHAIGDRVVMSPSVPRSFAVRAVEETIRASGGLFAVGTTTFAYAPATIGYALPAGVKTVLSVAWYPPTGNVWVPMRRWSHDKVAGMLILGEAVSPGADVRVQYAASPTVPTQAQDFSVTGLPDSCIDVIRYGAAWKLTNFLEPASLLAQGAEPDANKRQGQGGMRMRVAGYFYQLYRTRLEEEVRSLQEDYPIRIHYGAL